MVRCSYPFVVSFTHMAVAVAMYSADCRRVYRFPFRCLPIHVSSVVGFTWDFALMTHPAVRILSMSMVISTRRRRVSADSSRISSTYWMRITSPRKWSVR